MTPVILVAYDGSADAQTAIDRAAELMPGSEAVVLTVWEPIIAMLAGSGSLGPGMGMGGYVDSEKIDAASREAALSTATEGARRATAAGLLAQPRSESREGDLANTILVAAAEVDATLIVMGTRGLNGVMAFLLGSVSHAVVQHADRPVLVVPSRVLAERRHDHVHHAAALA